ncbi:MAG: Coq4 family protein [Candidatus Binatia bacterium]
MVAYDRLAERYLDGVPLAFATRDLGDDVRRALAAPARLAPALLSPWWARWRGRRRRRHHAARRRARRRPSAGAARRLRARCASTRATTKPAGWPPMPRRRWRTLRADRRTALGETLRRLIVDNGYDLDVLDPASVAGYHAELDEPNRYILQTHEIWHLVAGYSTSPGHEVAISGFQLAQFGHPYSRDFLAAIIALTTFTAPVTACFVIQLALEGWRHGRRTPPLTLVDWPARLDDPVACIRAGEGVEPYASLIPDAPPSPAA